MINKLIENIKKTQAPVVVGLDPMLDYIPSHILDQTIKERGRRWRRPVRRSGSTIKGSLMPLMI